jgi:hypothetical protein
MDVLLMTSEVLSLLWGPRLSPRMMMPRTSEKTLSMMTKRMMLVLAMSCSLATAG